MDNRFILRSVDAGVMTLTMNRPDVLNSCNRGMVTELRHALEGAGTDAAGARGAADRCRSGILCAGRIWPRRYPRVARPRPTLVTSSTATMGSSWRCADSTSRWWPPSMGSLRGGRKHRAGFGLRDCVH